MGSEPYCVVEGDAAADDDQSRPMKDVVVAAPTTARHDHDTGTLVCDTQYKSPRLVPMTIMGSRDDSGQCTNKLVAVVSSNGATPTIMAKRGLVRGRDHSEALVWTDAAAAAAAAMPLVGSDTFHSTSRRVVGWSAYTHAVLWLGDTIFSKSGGGGSDESSDVVVVVVAKSGCCILQSNVVLSF
jgi:hypothetical protein